MLRQVGTSPAEAGSSTKWFGSAVFVAVVLVLAMATRSTPQAAPSVGFSDGRSVTAYARIAQLAALLDAATDAETSSRGYVITGDAGFLSPFARALALETTEMRKLEALYAGAPAVTPVLRGLHDAFASRREHMSRSVELRRTLGEGQAARVLANFRGRELTDSVRVAIKVLMIAEQSVLAGERGTIQSASFAESRMLIAGGALGALALAFGLAVQVGRTR